MSRDQVYFFAGVILAVIVWLLHPVIPKGVLVVLVLIVLLAIRAWYYMQEEDDE